MSAKEPTVLLEHYLKQLKLPTVLREYEALAATCANEGVDYKTYVKGGREVQQVAV